MKKDEVAMITKAVLGYAMLLVMVGFAFYLMVGFAHWLLSDPWNIVR